MSGAQHKAIGICTGVAAASVLAPNNPVASVAIIALSGAGSMIPDIDHHNSKLGRTARQALSVFKVALALAIIAGIVYYFLGKVGKVPEMSPKAFLTLAGVILGVVLFYFISQTKTFKWMAHHRGVWHTLVIPALVIVAMRFAPQISGVAKPLVIGFCSHLAADCLTIAGCPLMWPLTRKYITLVPQDKKKDDKKRKASVARRCSLFCFIMIGIAAINMKGKFML